MASSKSKQTEASRELSTAEAQMADAARISSPQTGVQRILGSHSSAAMLRPRQPNGLPEPPLPPVPPPPPVSSPDLAFQFALCLADIPAPGVDLEDALIAALREAFGSEADVRYRCVNGRGTVGVWLRAAGSSTVSDARDRGVQRIDILAGGENFAFFINASFIRRRAQETWQSMPKRLDGDGRPDSDGPIHLTGLSLSFRSPNQVLTRVDGFDERPWPDVDFRLTITDTLSLASGGLTCNSERDLDTDTSWLNVLTGVFLLVFPPLGLFFLTERIIIGTVDAPEQGAGAGCAAAELIPSEVLIPGGLQIDTFYSRIQVNNGGIFAGGTASPSRRQPRVDIRGRARLSVTEGSASTSANYSIATEGMLAPLRVQWTADGTVSSPNASSTTIRFNTSGADAGQVLSKRVRVRVTDRDNLTAEDELEVRVHVTPVELDEPPVCLKRPWLPQCQPL